MARWMEIRKGADYQALSNAFGITPFTARLILTNEDALKYPDDLYLLAAYETCKGKIWIITNRISENAGDNATTVCFPSER